MMQLPNGSGRPWRRMKKEKPDWWDGSYRKAHVSPDKGVVDVSVFLSLKLILKSWQLCLSFKLDVLTTYAPKTERNIDHELLSASLILLYMYLLTYTL